MAVFPSGAISAGTTARGIAFVIALLAALPAMAQPSKPNVVFILADNVGYGDLGSYGGGELRGAPTPRLDQLAHEGLRLTQYLVEPSCTPSRAALMTGQYSIRNGMSLVGIPPQAANLPEKAFTMGELFKEAGYSTAIFGKWHLGGGYAGSQHSLPTEHGFDEFYGIPPDFTWDSATYPETMVLTHSFDRPGSTERFVPGENLTPHIVQAVAHGPLQRVRPYTPELRAEIDTDLVARSIDFIERQAGAGKPFFLYLPFSMGHFPNYPSQEFKGQSRIGNYGDKLIEGDAHVGRIVDTLKRLGIDDNTLLVFASDNGPQGETVRELGNLGTPDMGNAGPFRGELGEATEGSIRTCAILRWPGRIRPGTTSNAMFSIMDFLPTFARIIDASLPGDRPIDGVDQTDLLFGRSVAGHRESLLTFIGPDMTAVRWRQWRIYFSDVHPSGIGPQRQPGLFAASSPMVNWPKVYNIEMDPHEDLVVAGQFPWVISVALEVVEKYKDTLKAYPNPPPPNVTRF